MFRLELFFNLSDKKVSSARRITFEMSNLTIVTIYLEYMVVRAIECLLKLTILQLGELIS